MKLQAFIDKYAGQANVGDTPENTGECVGLIEVWLNEQGHPANVWGNAKDLLANAGPEFVVISNTADNYPLPGDILCFNGRWGGGFGHTGVVTSANVDNFTLFEQNNPTGSAPHLVDHPNYSNVQGWMRLKNNQGGEEVIQDLDNEFNRANDTFIRIRGRAMSREEFRKNIVGVSWLRFIEILVDGSQEANDAQHAQEVGQVALRDNWAGQIGGLQQKVTDLTEQAQAQQKTIVGLNDQIKTLQTALEAAKTTPVVQPPTSTTPALPASPTAPHAVKTAIEHFLAGENGKIALQVGGAVLFYVLDNAANFGIPSGLAAAIGLALGHTVANRTANKVNN